MTIISEAVLREQTERFMALGLSEREARTAALGRDGEPADPYDRAVQRYRRLGLSETAARAAVRGRDHSTDSAARRALTEAYTDPGPIGNATASGRRITAREFAGQGQQRPQDRPKTGAKRAAGTRVPLVESGATRHVAISECACGVTHTRADECPKCRRPVAR